MLDKFSWLHLSDFHFRSDRDRFSQEVSCEAVLRDIPSRLSNGFPLQFVVVTGDIAFSGQANEYELASDFFESLMQNLGLDAGRVCIVPGNHDVDRNLQPYMYDGVRSSITNQQAVDGFLGRRSEINQLMERQSAFRDFRDRLLAGFPMENTEDGLACVRLLDLDGFRVCILELNSAWLSGPNDRAGSLLIGERQIIKALELAENQRPHLLLALAHHPLDWLTEFDRLSCNNRLVRPLDIFHSGHLHRHQALVMLASGSQCLHSSAGSSHETRHYRNAYNLLEYDVGMAICKIRQFEYDADSGGFHEMEGMEYPIPWTRDLPVTATQIANVLRDHVTPAGAYADYMAALLTRDLNEVPISLSPGSAIFASKDMPSEYRFSEVEGFLRIANLIRIYDEVPLSEIIPIHQATISGFAGLLSRLSSSDPQFATFLADRQSQAQKIAGYGIVDNPPYQTQHLDDLAQSGDLDDLIDAAIRYQKSSFEEVRIAASRHLASALLQSEDLASRQKGLACAFQHLDQPWASSVDYCIAAAAAESFGEYKRAESTVLEALGHWPEDPQLREYCRNLVTQTGSQNLRQRLDETGVNGQ